MKTKINYPEIISNLEVKGKELFSSKFTIEAADHLILHRLICYFCCDTISANKLDIDLEKGIFITGPVGCGKTSLMNLMRFLQPVPHRFVVKSCRDLSFEFMKDGYDTVLKYSHRSFEYHNPKVYCFDDLGAEHSLKFYGNECNIMAEILLSRYDLFVSRKLITHITTNLSATEIESAYGIRVRSRMRSLFNLLAFTSPDKRR